MVQEFKRVRSINLINLLIKDQFENDMPLDPLQILLWPLLGTANICIFCSINSAWKICSRDSQRINMPESLKCCALLKMKREFWILTSVYILFQYEKNIRIKWIIWEQRLVFASYKSKHKTSRWNEIWYLRSTRITCNFWY